MYTGKGIKKNLFLLCYTIMYSTYLDRVRMTHKRKESNHGIRYICRNIHLKQIYINRSHKIEFSGVI